MNDNSNSKDDLPRRIKSIRQQLGLSQEELPTNWVSVLQA